MLTIFGRINSHNVKKVVWLADEIGLPYDRVDMGGSFGFTDEYLALNPNAMIPSIRYSDFSLWESNAILRYLAEKYAPQFRAEDLQVRAAGDKWMDWQFHFADTFRDAFLGMVRTPSEQRDHAAIAKSAKAGGLMMAMLDAELATRPYISGDSFGIADIPMAVYARTYFGIDIERPDLPHLNAWYGRLLMREPFTRIAAVPLS